MNSSDWYINRQLKALFLLAHLAPGILVFVTGCGAEPTLDPVLAPSKINVDTHENLERIKLTIQFDGDFHGNMNGEAYRYKMDLNLTEEELADYRKQVEFLLGKIDEATAGEIRGE